MKKNKRFFSWWQKSKTHVETGISLAFTKNKAVGVEIMYSKSTCDWFRFSTEWSHKQDYAGFEVEFSLLWINFLFRICDTRCWDYANNCWGQPPPTEEERPLSKFNYEWF